jgi:dihydroorotase
LWVHPLAAATRGLAGSELAELALMRDAGARAVATGRHWVSDSGLMLRLLRYCAMLGLVVVSHAEDAGLAGGAVATRGRDGDQARAAQRAGRGRGAGGRTRHRAGRACRGAAALAASHDRRGPRAGPQRQGAWSSGDRGRDAGALHAVESAIGDFRTFTRLSPPLRSEADRQAVRAAIADGTIDVIASGHDPRGPRTSACPLPMPNRHGRRRDPAGVNPVASPGRVIDLPGVSNCSAENRPICSASKAGRLAVGAEADLALIDPERPWIVDSAQMAAAAGNTPFDRQPVQGRRHRPFQGRCADRACERKQKAPPFPGGT